MLREGIHESNQTVSCFFVGNFSQKEGLGYGCYGVAPLSIHYTGEVNLLICSRCFGIMRLLESPLTRRFFTNQSFEPPFNLLSYIGRRTLAERLSTTNCIGIDDHVCLSVCLFECIFPSEARQASSVGMNLLRGPISNCGRGIGKVPA